mgnify:CR=1 FL=1
MALTTKVRKEKLTSGSEPDVSVMVPPATRVCPVSVARKRLSAFWLLVNSTFRTVVDDPKPVCTAVHPFWSATLFGTALFCTVRPSTVTVDAAVPSWPTVKIASISLQRKLLPESKFHLKSLFFHYLNYVEVKKVERNLDEKDHWKEMKLILKVPQTRLKTLTWGILMK